MRSRRMPVVVLAAVVAGGMLAGCHTGTGHSTHRSKKSRSRSMPCQDTVVPAAWSAAGTTVSFTLSLARATSGGGGVTSTAG
ncbi:hypothetical protein [Streptomyces sp. NPDC021224]|uniref:hypothetical protein n=1 Tax=Streptomyces sp. NPDC021224 TaxID=3365120 RepID=UPI0037A73255